jgi:hypothetical protein
MVVEMGFVEVEVFREVPSSRAQRRVYRRVAARMRFFAALRMTAFLESMNVKIPMNI